LTEPDFPYKKPPIEIPPEKEKPISPSPDIKKPKPEDQPVEKEEAGTSAILISGRSFNTQSELDLHMSASHGKPRENE